MKELITLSFILLSLTGCVTKKIPVNPAAKNISKISEHSVNFLRCELLKTHTIQGAHPNNIEPELKNVTYKSGGNHFSIIEVLDTKKKRPSSVVAAIYQCGKSSDEAKVSSEMTQLLPGAHMVKAISFAEIENSTCKLIGSHFVKKTSPEAVMTNLANETYMMSGNRYQITKIISIQDGAPTSVYADIYRCKHKSAHF